MFDTHELGAFLLTVFVLIVVPGPSVLFVVSRALALGRRAALATVVGNAAGLSLQVALVALGVGTIVAESAALFTVIKLLGAAYLVVLGARVLRDRRKLAQLLDAAAAPRDGDESFAKDSSSARPTRKGSSSSRPSCPSSSTGAPVTSSSS